MTDCSFLCILFRAKGHKRDTWHVVQVRSTELVYNEVTVGDLHNASLENPIGVRLVAFERGHTGLPQVAISELDDLKL